jgi:signal transduction histidine kinase
MKTGNTDSPKIASSASPDRARRQLRYLLLAFFCALAVPVYFLLHRVYRQLENETLYQYRMSAEELVGRMNAHLQDVLDTEEARSFDDYSFYKVGNVPLQAGKGLTYSPLAEFPPKTQMPGMMGYFQLNPDGSLQSPILPKIERNGISETPPEIEGEELAKRIAAWDRLFTVLASQDETAAPAEAAAAGAQQENVVRDAVSVLRGREAKKEMSENEIAQVVLGSRNAKQQLVPEKLLEEGAQFEGAKKVTELNLDGQYLPRDKGAAGSASVAPQAKSSAGAPPEAVPQRSRRKEKVELPAPVSAGASKPQSPGTAAESAASETARRQKAKSAVKALSLEGEVDPFQFKFLDELHLMFVRKVWREGQRFLQGFVVDGEAFFKEFVDTPFRTSAISQNSNMIVGYRGIFFRRVNATGGASIKGSRALRELVLYRAPLAAPFDKLELLITTPALPAPPGQRVVNMLAVALFFVLIGGLVGMYRLGVRHIVFAKERSDFVSAVSHELKTPLTSIRMYSEMLRSGWVEDETKKKSYYDYIFSESERLSRLISNVLQFARLTNNDSPLELKPVFAEQLLDIAREKVATQIESGGYVLNSTFEGEKKAFQALIEEDAFSRIAINLADNALKFSANTTQKIIELTVKASADSVVFSVRDYGPGVPRDQMKRIFRLFYRAEDELHRSTPGTGIGLALVKELADKMNATVDLKNRNPGAEFQLVFPVVEPQE